MTSHVLEAFRAVVKLSRCLRRGEERFPAGIQPAVDTALTTAIPSANSRAAARSSSRACSVLLPFAGYQLARAAVQGPRRV
jgi:hypothetical protein